MSTPAHEAFHRWHTRPRSTTPAHARNAPAPPPLDTPRQDPPRPAPTADALNLLTRDAARRATALLRGDTRAQTHPDPLHDAARMLTHPDNQPYLQDAAAALNLSTVEMKHLALAHAHGGPANVDVTRNRRTTNPAHLADAQHAIQPLRPAPTATLVGEDNRLTDAAARIQLRYGDGRWYPFVDWHGTWRPVAGHSTNPANAYTGARRALRRP
ncbi:hypothetical protein OG948_60605 (plasmid) [Embleya sp. NBC_00888]|uniref:hypothetical protein n=1 Tax=Embleya sp. NBC_00888 TaxID=2975960 RepID=UPI0038658CE4|nr:hypothetical protein OG948_60605 [Embleya sp. NBC_00888]